MENNGSDAFHENVIYNELRMRGYRVDVGNLTIVENGRDSKTVKKQLEVDFICSKGSKKDYIQGILMISVYDFLLNAESLDI